MNIVSLTSYGYRLLETAPKAIASLYTEDFEPDKVILYVAHEDKQFIKNQFKNIPRLEIRFVDDLKSHKKFFALADRTLDGDFIIIVDDDLEYKPYFWGKLWAKYDQHKNDSNNFIVCNRAQLISGKQYNKTPFVMKDDADLGKFRFGSGSGLLIPPHTMRINKATLYKGYEVAPHCDESYYSCFCVANDIDTYTTGKPQPFHSLQLPKKDPKGLWQKFNQFEKDDVLARCKKFFGIDKGEEIFVSFTSWKKRIQSAPDVVKRMRAQTYKPAKIILTLSVDEFPNKLNDLPTELVKLQGEDFEIRWVQENSRTFKKLEPLFYIHPEHWVLLIDDDIPYDSKFIETMFNSVKGNNPVTGSHLKTTYNQYGNILSCAGAYCLIKPLHCLPYLKQMKEYLHTRNMYDVSTDPLVTYSVLLNGYKFTASKTNFLPLARKSNLPEPYSKGDGGKERNKASHQAVQQFIKGLNL